MKTDALSYLDVQNEEANLFAFGLAFALVICCMAYMIYQVFYSGKSQPIERERK